MHFFCLHPANYRMRALSWTKPCAWILYPCQSWWMLPDSISNLGISRALFRWREERLSSTPPPRGVDRDRWSSGGPAEERVATGGMAFGFGVRGSQRPGAISSARGHRTRRSEEQRLGNDGR